MTEAEAKSDVFLQPDGRRDFALLVEGKKVYINRELLACWSPVFEKIFYPEGAAFEQPDGGMVMKGKNLNEFLTFLHAVFPTTNTMIVDESNVETLVAYADEYDVGALRERCVKYLDDQLKGDVAGETLINYLRLATIYNLKDTQKQLVPRVAQLTIDKIEASHEKLPLSVLSAIFHSKASALQTAVDSTLPLPKGAVYCVGCGSNTCTISEGASSCCNLRVLILSMVIAELEEQWEFTCAHCRKSCSFTPTASRVYRHSQCCHVGMFVKPKSKVCKKRSADTAAAVPPSKAANFSAVLLGRQQ